MSKKIHNIKSVHFKNTVKRSSVLSKLWSFSICNASAEIETKSADVFIIENNHNFDTTEDRATVLLKWTDFSTLLILVKEII